MLILWKTMIVIFTYEMSFVKCVLSDHYVFLLQLLHSAMHIYLQNRCTNFSKQIIQKMLYTLEKRKGQFHFGGQGYHAHFARQYILQLDQYVCNTMFLLNPTWIIIVHFVLWFISNMFLFFYSCYCISYNSTLESFLDEIKFFCAMPKYDVMFIINPIWHCFLSEKQCVKICCGIPCQIVMWH